LVGALTVAATAWAMHAHGLASARQQSA
jgi:hypothetical protein